MRFCMVTTFYPPYHFGGDATYVRAISRALAARGHEVEVVHCEDAYRMLSHDRRQGEAFDDEGIRVHRLKSRFGLLSPLITQQTGRPGFKIRALRAVLDRGFDVVNFHNISLVGGPAVLKLSRAPVTLYTLHEHWLLCPTHILWKNRSHACDKPECIGCTLRSGIPPQLWRYTGMMRRCLDSVDAFIAPSEFTAQQHRAAGIVKPIHVVPLFSTLDPGPSVEYTCPPRPRFLYVGRVTASKGIIPLLDYFSNRADVELCVVGEGDLRAPLQQRHAGEAHIRFLGHVPQARLAEIYREATALVFPSLAPETFGLSIAEAFACGTPAIVRDAGGSRELIDATGAGFVYRTETELHNAVQRLIDDDALRGQLGRRARAGFERWYTRQRHVDAYLDCIAAIQKRKTLRSCGPL